VRRRRRARTTSSSLDSACSSFSTSSRPPKMPFHTRDTSPRCRRFSVAGVSGGMGDRGDAVTTDGAAAGASPSAMPGDRSLVGSDPIKRLELDGPAGKAGEGLVPAGTPRTLRAVPLCAPRLLRERGMEDCFVEARFRGGPERRRQERKEAEGKGVAPRGRWYVSPFFQVFFNRTARDRASVDWPGRHGPWYNVAAVRWKLGAHMVDLVYGRRLGP
jgi:hypothetical protein